MVEFLSIHRAGIGVVSSHIMLATIQSRVHAQEVRINGQVQLPVVLGQEIDGILFIRLGEVHELGNHSLALLVLTTRELVHHFGKETLYWTDLSGEDGGLRFGLVGLLLFELSLLLFGARIFVYEKNKRTKKNV